MGVAVMVVRVLTMVMPMVIVIVAATAAFTVLVMRRIRQAGKHVLGVGAASLGAERARPGR